MKRRKKSWIVPAVCFLITVVAFRVIFFLGYVPSSSMEPAIAENSCILGLRHTGGLAVGDIIIFQRDANILVKRIAACPGDSIFFCDDKVYLLDPSDEWAKKRTVPAGCYYVLGDNTLNSYDSRFWHDNPFVKQEDILARVLFH